MSTLTRYLEVCRRIKELRAGNYETAPAIRGHAQELRRLKKERDELHALLFSNAHSNGSSKRRAMKRENHSAAITPAEHYGIGSISIYD